MPITTLLIDIGGVLLTNGWDHAAREAAARQFKIDFKEMDSRHRLAFDTYEIGKMSLEEYLNQAVFYEKRNFTQKQFQEFMFAQSKSLPKMIPWITSLKEKYGLKVATVSNEGRELTVYRRKKFHLDLCIDFFVSSGFVGLRKPDAAIFRLAVDMSQVAPDEMLYIDDRILFIEVAQKLGIPSLQHVDYKTTRAQLAKLGLK